MADRWGAGDLTSLLGLIAAGMTLLAISARIPILILSAVIFGTGFGSAYPAFALHSGASWMHAVAVRPLEQSF